MALPREKKIQQLRVVRTLATGARGRDLEEEPHLLFAKAKMLGARGAQGLRTPLRGLWKKRPTP